jgi:hypothetical protein
MPEAAHRRNEKCINNIQAEKFFPSIILSEKNFLKFPLIFLLILEKQVKRRLAQFLLNNKRP